MAKTPRKRGRPANPQDCSTVCIYLPNPTLNRLDAVVDSVDGGNRSKVVADLLDKHLPNGRKPGRKK